MCFLNNNNSNCIYFSDIWSELQKLSKSDSSIIATTFSELDVQHNYLFQLINSERTLTVTELKSMLRVILFPSRRLLRYLEENYSIIGLTENNKINVDIPKDLEQIINNLSGKFCNNDNDMKKDKPLTSLDNQYTSTATTVNSIPSTINDKDEKRKINSNTYDFSSLSFEDKVILNGIHVMLQHFYRIYKIYFPKYDFDYCYDKLTSNVSQMTKENKNVHVPLHKILSNTIINNFSNLSLSEISDPFHPPVIPSTMPNFKVPVTNSTTTSISTNNIYHPYNYSIPSTNIKMEYADDFNLNPTVMADSTHDYAQPLPMESNYNFYSDTSMMMTPSLYMNSNNYNSNTTNNNFDAYLLPTTTTSSMVVKSNNENDAFNNIIVPSLFKSHPQTQAQRDFDTLSCNDYYPEKKQTYYDFNRRKLSLDYTPGFDTDRIYEERKETLLVTPSIGELKLYAAVDDIFNYIDYLEGLGVKLNCFRARHILPKVTTSILMKWIKEHRQFPYPTTKEKEMLCKETGLNKKQLNCWFINARRRYLRSH